MMAQYFLENLTHLLEEKGLNQSSLARGLGTSQASVSNWFKRKSLPNTETIEALAKFLNVEPFYFFMKPGTQTQMKPLDNENHFRLFLNELAQKLLDEEDLRAYDAQGGADTFLRIMRSNYETNRLGFSDWYLKLVKEVAKYASLDLVEKARSRVRQIDEAETKKNGTS